mgnify:CR=1 FL=1
MKQYSLPSGIEVFERGWLSSNNIFHYSENDVSLVDTGYVAHQSMTLGLVRNALSKHDLSVMNKVVNTHLHSDHCGGNAALRETYDCQIYIPASEAKAVQDWNEDLLSYQNLGQEVAQTLDLIESLSVSLVIPGHGKPFADVATALATARSRLDYLASDPDRNARHGAKVLLKYKLLDWRSKEIPLVNQWISQTLSLIHI